MPQRDEKSYGAFIVPRSSEPTIIIYEIDSSGKETKEEFFANGSTEPLKHYTDYREDIKTQIERIRETSKEHSALIGKIKRRF